MLNIEQRTLTPITTEDIFKRSPGNLFKNAKTREVNPERSEEVVTEGSFFDFFMNIYIPGYIQRLNEYQPESLEAVSQLNSVLEKFLPTILKCPLIQNRELISGVAQALTYHFVTQQVEGEGRLPPWHWDLRPKYARTEKACTAAGRVEAARFYKSLGGDADLDMKWGVNGNKMSDIVAWLHNTLKQNGMHKITDLNTEGSSADTKIQRDYHGATFDVVYNEYIRIRFIGGPLPHNPKIDIFSMWIYDRSAEIEENGVLTLGNRIYHVEARNIPENAEEMDDDLRGGMTFNGQDGGSVHLYPEENHDIRFVIPKRAVESMLFQDELIIKPEKINPAVEESRKAARLTESPVRMARMRICMDLGFIWTRDRESKFVKALSVPDFNFTWPQLWNLFELNARVRELSIYGIGIHPERKLLFAQEMAVMFDKNPWEAIRFLQFSGLYLLTKWKNKTPEEFEQMLSSVAMVVEPTGADVAGPRPDKRREKEFQERQMRLYLSGNTIDGLERVMKAENPANKGKEVEAFLDMLGIFEDELSISSIVPFEIRLPDTAATQLKVNIPVSVTSGGKEIYISAEYSLTAVDIRRLGATLEAYGRPMPNVIENADRHRKLVHSASDGTLLAHEIKMGKSQSRGIEILRKLFFLLPNNAVNYLAKRGVFVSRETEEYEQLERWREHDLCILVEILHQYPFITPRHLEGLYKLFTQDREVRTNSDEEYKFDSLMHHLFSTGLVERRQFFRIQQKTGEIVPVEYLSLRSSGSSHPFGELLANRDFCEYWFRNGHSERILEDTCRRLIAVYIPTLESFGSMSERDLRYLEARLTIPNANELWQKARLLHEEAMRYLSA
ncbi:MAG: hypothetical protein AAB874_04615 [Patescibacteria group bacterium]